MKNRKVFIALLLVLALAVAAFAIYSAVKPAPAEPELQQGQSIEIVTPQDQPQSSALEQPNANSPPEAESQDPQQTENENAQSALEILSGQSEGSEAPEAGAQEEPSDTPLTVSDAEITDPESETEPENAPSQELLPEDGYYYSKDEVALYIHQYGKLPGNFITKKEAEKLGWNGGSLEKYAPGKVIGGSQFGNREGLLPSKEGRKYYECDIDTLGEKKRGAKRIVFSNDGLIYYTEDHYESFELLYGNPK